MMIKTPDGEKSVASLGLAIPGTVALVNQLAGNGGIFGGLFNGGNNCNAQVSALAFGQHAHRLEEENNRLKQELEKLRHAG